MNVYICEGCNLFYNSALRKPTILSCGHVICNQCINIQISKEGSFKSCPISDSCSIDENFKMFPVIPLMNNLEKLNTININCDTHPDKLVKIYCKTTHQLLCRICSTACPCINQKNSEHQNILRKDVEDYIQHKYPILQNLLERIQVIIKSLSSYQNKDKMLKASEFLDLVTQINKFQSSDQPLEELSLFHNELQTKMSTFENLENIQINMPMQPNEKSVAELCKIISEKDKPKNFRGLVDYQIVTFNE
ncbi:tripartite motif-containing protein 34 [Stylonychia lemnae]|uniref:Tripartite motif-containing protein 34 n=1 Tax=Stylonychia lemnae TaxID=5949 RepID=A0A078B6R5_STYLE|nr:tripartite motif-containing protein 34 [Stylonychia lemnae]|eukprot:CDW90235.1 tripartite motif-containing protein 34 [Stylonychia lemnae]